MLDQEAIWIPLSQGQFALVDSADYAELSKHKWSALWSGNPQSFYASRQTSRREWGGRKLVLMHRIVMGLALRGQRHIQVDHIDHDTLNNTKANLNCVNNRLNQHNRRDRVGGKCASLYTGVTRKRAGGRWSARIDLEGRKRVYLGAFDDEEDAAIAYIVAYCEACRRR